MTALGAQPAAANFTSRFATLTPAEREVAQHLSHGLLNKEISALLGKAEPTIKHQVSSILEKTGTQSRCRFIAHYYQQFFCLLPTAPICDRRTGRDSAASAFALAELRRDKKNPPVWLDLPVVSGRSLVRRPMPTRACPAAGPPLAPKSG